MADEAGKLLSQNDLIELTSSVVAAYVSRNAVAPADMPGLIRLVHATLSEIAGAPAQSLARLTQRPAVPIAQSIEDEYIICLEDGKKFKSLKRHLRACYEMTAEDYRLKWNLPPDYPMVAPGYSRRRSALAVKSGLGRSDKA